MFEGLSRIEAQAVSNCHQGLIAPQSLGASGHGLAVAAPTVTGRIGNQSGTDGVEVDVGGDGGKGRALGTDQDAFEAFLPECAAPAVAEVVPLAEALFKFFEVLADIAHALPEALAQSVFLNGEQGGVGELSADLLDVCWWVNGADALEQFCVVGRGFWAFWDFDEEVEVVAHEAEGEDLDAAEMGVLAHQAGEVLLFDLAEDELSIHHAGHAVVEAAGGIGMGLEASCSHEASAS